MYIFSENIAKLSNIFTVQILHYKFQIQHLTNILFTTQFGKHRIYMLIRKYLKYANDINPMKTL